MTSRESGKLGPGSRPPRIDVVLAVVLAVFSLILFMLRPEFDDAAKDQAAWSYAFPVIASLLLALRRVRPVTTLLAIVAVVALYLVLVDTPGPMAIPVLIGLYSVASHGDRKRSILAAGYAAIVISIAALTVGPETPTAVSLGAAVLVTTLPILVGDIVRTRRALIVETDQRVKLAEASAVQHARQQVLDERVRIARELHDVVAHSIATINVQAGVAAHVIDDSPEAAKQALVEIKDASKAALGELRSMLGVLRDEDESATPLAPSPGIDEIATLVDRYVGEIDYTVEGARPEQVDPVIGLIAYRIVQEGLTNVMKHAEGALVEVQLKHLEQSIQVSVTDNGRSPSSAGQTPDSVAGTGLGLLGLAERVRAVGGQLSTGARFDGGYQVAAELPYVPGLPVAEGSP